MYIHMQCILIWFVLSIIHEINFYPHKIASSEYSPRTLLTMMQFSLLDQATVIGRTGSKSKGDPPPFHQKKVDPPLPFRPA
jgi:hypothetical protein